MVHTEILPLLTKLRALFWKYIFLAFSIYFFFISPANGVTEWEKIKERGFLTWVTRPSPMTYYSGLDGVMGLEYQLLKEFCDSHGLELMVNVAESTNDLFNKFNSGKIDIAGANLTLTEERKSKYFYTFPYDQTQVIFVSSYNKPRILLKRGLEDYEGMILNRSSYEKVAKKLEKNYQAVIERNDEISLYELLVKVAEGSIDYTLADQNLVEMFKSFVPKVRIGDALSNKQKLVFLHRSGTDETLIRELNKFILQYRNQNKINEYKEYVIQSLPNSTAADTVNFIKNYNTRWAAIREMVYEVAEEYQMDPVLLGALSYQESHWNPRAVSPTLVKGLMMLTKAVAKEQGVEDRFDARQSLEGGVRHFQKMVDKIPDRITDPDRTQMALAAYNIGYGYLEKARVLTQRAGKNPDLWTDVADYLPLLNEIEDISADGRTAVRYVDNIYVYQNLLKWKEQNLIGISAE